MRMPKLPYSRLMIELIHEIRHHMPRELRPGVRFSNPDILENLADFYSQTDNRYVKLMIEKVLADAGEQWSKLIFDDEKRFQPVKLKKVKSGQSTTHTVDIASPANVVNIHQKRSYNFKQTAI